MPNIIKRLHVKYYALFREERRLSAEIYSTVAVDIVQLYDEVRNLYKFSLPLNMVRMAVNDQFVSSDYLLKDEDKIVFIPPVAGG